MKSLKESLLTESKTAQVMIIEDPKKVENRSFNCAVTYDGYACIMIDTPFKMSDKASVKAVEDDCRKMHLRIDFLYDEYMSEYPEMFRDDKYGCYVYFPSSDATQFYVYGDDGVYALVSD